VRYWYKQRWAEFFGLLLVALIYFTGLALIDKEENILLILQSYWQWPLLLLSVHLSLRFILPLANQILFVIVAFLATQSLLILKSLGGNWFNQQFNWLLISMVALLAVVSWLKEPSRLANYKYLFGVSALTLLILPAVAGVEHGGSRLWLNFFGYSFQPAEFAKVLLIVFLAAYLAEKREVLSFGQKRFLGLFWPAAKHFAPVFVMWSLSLLILIFERDLGTSLLFLSLFLLLLYLATGRLAYVLVGVFLFLFGAWTSYFLFAHVKTRIDVWLNPLPTDVSGSVYQIAQALFAFAAGGLSGTGLGSGLLGRQIFMPAVQTDFILAVIGEELGFIGAGAVIVCYLVIASLAFSTARQQKNLFLALLMLGLASIVLLQALIITAGSLKFIPLTGLTLPFVSYGGSSLLANFILVGLMLKISALKRN